MQTYFAKSILVSKTFWFNLLTMLVAVLEANDVINVLPPGWMKYVPAILAIVNIILRGGTTRPVALIGPSETKPVAVKSI